MQSVVGALSDIAGEAGVNEFLLAVGDATVACVSEPAQAAIRQLQGCPQAVRVADGSALSGGAAHHAGEEVGDEVAAVGFLADESGYFVVDDV